LLVHISAVCMFVDAGSSDGVVAAFECIFHLLLVATPHGCYSQAAHIGSRQQQITPHAAAAPSVAWFSSAGCSARPETRLSVCAITAVTLHTFLCLLCSEALILGSAGCMTNYHMLRRLFQMQSCDIHQH